MLMNSVFMSKWNQYLRSRANLGTGDLSHIFLTYTFYIKSTTHAHLIRL